MDIPGALTQIGRTDVRPCCDLPVLRAQYLWRASVEHLRPSVKPSPRKIASVPTLLCINIPSLVLLQSLSRFFGNVDAFHHCLWKQMVPPL